MIPEQVGKYRIEAPLGQGGTGIVYRARREKDGRAVALKLLPPEQFPDPQTRKKFLSEAKRAAKLKHPHLRRLYEAGEHEGQLYLALEYIEGATLKSLLVGGAVDPDAALGWGTEIAEALATAHAGGCVHGELSPGKVFITAEGTAKLSPPGLWRLRLPVGEDLTQEGAIERTRLSPRSTAALAPEQLQGREPDARSDVFALGTLLCEMTTGRNPFVGDTAVETMHLVLKRTPQPLPEAAPAALGPVVERALAKDSAQRVGSAATMQQALRAVAAGEEPQAALEAAPSALMRVLLPFWIAIGVALLLLLLWFVYLGLTAP
ncbi:MAG: serine/threonine-protein kinase [Terriglobia bacterium]